LSFNEAVSVPHVDGKRVLIKVHATAINPVAWKPVPRFLMQRVKVPCLDIAGTVLGAGSAVGKVELGDEVMAMLDFRQPGGVQDEERGQGLDQWR